MKGKSILKRRVGAWLVCNLGQSELVKGLTAEWACCDREKATKGLRKKKGGGYKGGQKEHVELWRFQNGCKKPYNDVIQR